MSTAVMPSSAITTRSRSRLGTPSKEAPASADRGGEAKQQRRSRRGAAVPEGPPASANHKAGGRAGSDECRLVRADAITSPAHAITPSRTKSEASENVPAGAGDIIVFASPMPGMPAKTSPKGRLFGSPAPAPRAALGDVTNSDKDKAKMTSAVAPSPAKALPLLTPARVPPQSPAGIFGAGSRRAGAQEGQAKQEVTAAADGKIKGDGAEEVLRLEVSRILKDQPAVTQTPIMGRQLSRSDAAADDVATAERAPGSVGKVSSGGVGVESDRSCVICYSPIVMLAPTPNNTPAAGVAPPAEEAKKEAKQGGSSSALLAQQVPSLHIATPVGKLRPMPQFSESPESDSWDSHRVSDVESEDEMDEVEERIRDPARLLRAISALQQGLQQAAVTGSPDSTTVAAISASRILSFDETPAHKRRSSTDGGSPSAAGAVAGAAAVPASPAWSLDVHMGTPAVIAATRLTGSRVSTWREEDKFEEGDYDEEYDDGEYYDDEEYGDEEEMEGEHDAARDLCSGMASMKVASPSATVLRGMPVPAGRHVRFGGDPGASETTEQ